MHSVMCRQARRRRHPARDQHHSTDQPELCVQIDKEGGSIGRHTDTLTKCREYGGLHCETMLGSEWAGFAVAGSGDIGPVSRLPHGCQCPLDVNRRWRREGRGDCTPLKDKDVGAWTGGGGV